MKAGCVFRNDQCVLERVWYADRAVDRMRGLLGRNELAAGEGMMITPCAMIHTFWMRFAIDVVFLSAQRVVIGIRHHVRPWRFAFAAGAAVTLELRQGDAKRLSIQQGDTLIWQEAGA